MVVTLAVSLVLFVYCLVDLVTTPAALVRTLPKPVWFVALLPPVFGPVAWLLAGRAPRGTDRRPARPAAPERAAPDDDDDFLRELRRRADDQRRRARDPRDDDPT